jgi:hypothetical protein
LVLMCDNVRGGAMKASKVQVITGKKGIPLMIKDEWPFFINQWSDEETGYESVDEYYLVFDFREGFSWRSSGGLLVEASSVGK